MINLKEGVLSRMALHKVGSNQEGNGLHLSDNETDLSDPQLRGTLQKYFLSGFKDQTYYNLGHENDIALNEVFHFAEIIFNDPESIFEVSKELAKHLYSISDHPNIKEGDFCVAYLENLQFNEGFTDAIGIFKAENKDVFLKIGRHFDLGYDEGINISRLDKGCIIFNTEKENGYFLAIEDHTNKGNDAQYWKNKFLNVKPREDAFYHTKNYIHLCKNFVSEVLDKQENIEKTDQIDFLNRTSDFFVKKESFNVKDFEDEVIAEPQIIDKFRGFIKNYEEENALNIIEEFNISTPAVKSTKRVFKSVLKLDKNFHIYVHGNRQLIEKGFDEEKQMQYYKVYFTNEETS
jgi:hypothetical protein